MPTVPELQEKRANATMLGRELLDKAEKEKRDLSIEERAQWDRTMADVDKWGEQIKILTRQESLEKELSESQGRRTAPIDPSDPLGGKKRNKELRKMYKRLHMKGFRAYLKHGPDALRDYRSQYAKEFKEAREFRVAQIQAQFREDFGREPEYRDLQADLDVSGGFLVAPQQFFNSVIIFANNFVWMRKISTVQTVTSAQSLGVPTLDTDINDADWTSELATGNDDTAMAIGKREFYPHPLAKRILISNNLLRLSPTVEDLVRDRMGYKFGVAQEKAFISGTGSQQPLGVFTASAMGIPTTQDVNTGVVGSFNGDSLFEVKFSLKVQHQAAGVWVMHRTIVKNVRELKDGIGRYLWQPALLGPKIDGNTGMVVDTLLDRPLYMSEYAPNTVATGQYIGAFFNPKYYWIADAQQFQIQRLVELYAQTNQTGLIGRMACDGMPVLPEAFARMKVS